MGLVGLFLKIFPTQKLHFGPEMYLVKYFVDPVISLVINQLFLPHPRKEKNPESLSHSWTAEGINAFQKKCGGVHKGVSYHVFKAVPLRAAGNRKSDMEWELFNWSKYFIVEGIVLV